ncbi:unnamed protein product [Parnassius apollo]|uniref:(apollo) hypothetical protein n=1 Tax=Parnassius apollo TaxID=110799 RepID=A0A8S3Y362_PARAO|nr:unnamed protein product [Parnassius apollo]
MYTILVYLIFFTKVQSFQFDQFLPEQSDSILNFFKEQSYQVERALTSSYDRAVQMKNSFDNYVEEQKNKINTEINRCIENVKDKGRQIADSFSYLPTEEADSKLQNPDVTLTVPARIARNGYRCETHTVVSKGYLLNLHRIPHSKNDRKISSKTILLQHGIFASSADWIINGPDKALAYVLADAGYDVWMSNIRGNRYSKEHAWLKTNTKTYWNFSWHDVALHDIPNIIDYIIKLKGGGTKITYIGHSMGTTILFAMLTLRPEYNKILTGGYALAPVVFMSEFKSPIKSLAPVTGNVAQMEMLYGSHEFLLKNSMFGEIVSSCNVDYIDNKICKNIIFQLCGENEKQCNETLLPVFVSHYGDGTSWKTVLHFAQEIVASNKFQQFDFGPPNNQRMYGNDQPPEYDLRKITLPINLFWAQNDLLSSEKDVKMLLEKLPSTTHAYLVPDPKFNHLDYLWAIDASTLINAKILSSLQSTFKDQI